jgi:hypothetical protein
MAVYGNMLLAFPELLQEYTVFRLAPKIGGGFEKQKTDVRVAIGYLAWGAADKDIVQGETPEHEDTGTFWEQCDAATGASQVKHRDFVEVHGRLCRMFEHADFSRESGFMKWSVRSLPSFSDKQVRDKKVNLGARDFG